MNIIEQLEQEEIARLGKTLPAFAPGDTVVVQVKVKEGHRERLQAYDGVVIAQRIRGLNSGFTGRNSSSVEGVERTFQTYSPLVASVEVKRRGDVRRAKLSCSMIFMMMLPYIWRERCVLGLPTIGRTSRRFTWPRGYLPRAASFRKAPDECSARNSCSCFDNPCLAYRSGRWTAVIVRLCCNRHWAIAAWLPLFNTSGTAMPCQTSGRV